MAISANTAPKQVIDKNGKQTTVHAGKAQPDSKQGQRLASVRPHSSSSAELNSLSDYSPADVDESLASIYEDMSKKSAELYATRDRITRYEGYIERGGMAYQLDMYRERIKEYEQAVDKLEPEIMLLRAEAQPYEDEFFARGGWSRCFQVTNAGGHVHSSMQCSSCYDTTQYHWHANMSGMSEEEIIDRAGADACTVCYPDAPVSSLGKPGSLRTPEQKVKEAEREKREEEKRAKQAKAAEKAIFMPDGSPVYDHYGHAYKTETAAYRGALSDMESLWVYGTHPDMDKWARLITNVIDAVANKRGVDRAEIQKEILDKTAKKLKSDYGQDGVDSRREMWSHL